jgi:hypothetical protein
MISSFQVEDRHFRVGSSWTLGVGRVPCAADKGASVKRTLWLEWLEAELADGLFAAGAADRVTVAFVCAGLQAVAVDEFVLFVEDVVHAF